MVSATEKKLWVNVKIPRISQPCHVEPEPLSTQLQGSRPEMPRGPGHREKRQSLPPFTNPPCFRLGGIKHKAPHGKGQPVPGVKRLSAIYHQWVFCSANMGDTKWLRF